MPGKPIDHIAVPPKPEVTSLEIIGGDRDGPQLWQPLRVIARTKNAPEAILDRITWFVRLDGVPTPIPSQGLVGVRRDKLKIAAIPEQWLDKGIEISAGFKGQEPFPSISFVLKPKGIAEYITLVQKVEAAYPDWSPEQILAGLRRYAGVALGFFQDVLFGDKKVPEMPRATGPLTNDDIARLRALSEHGESSGGVANDLSGNPVALGHVLIGMAAGMHRSPWTWVHVWKFPAPIRVDKLYFVTIAGDLGQSVVDVMDQRKDDPKASPPRQRIGEDRKDTEATYAELIGDIDGVILGSTITTSPGALSSVSRVLRDYYCGRANARGDVLSNRRFRNFPSVSSPKAKSDVFEFAEAFYHQKHRVETGIATLLSPATLLVHRISLRDVDETVAAFDEWFNKMAAKELADERAANAQDEADVAAGWP